MATLLAETGGVFVHQVTPDLACCIAIENGLPVPGMDEVGARPDMIALAKTYVESRREAGEKITVYGDADYSELEGLEYQAMDREIIEKSPANVGKLIAASDKKGNRPMRQLRCMPRRVKLLQPCLLFRWRHRRLVRLIRLSARPPYHHCRRSSRCRPFRHVSLI